MVANYAIDLLKENKFLFENIKGINKEKITLI